MEKERGKEIADVRKRISGGSKHTRGGKDQCKG